MKPSLSKFSLSRLSILVAALVMTGACSGGSDPKVSFSDSGTPDAVPTPDAEACTQTLCEGLCVNTATDPLNCGGCGMACQSPGQICSGSTPCACPDPFVPANIGGPLDQVQMLGDIYAAFSPALGGTINISGIIYDLSLSVDTEYDFADSVAGLTPPAAAAGYDVDIGSMTAHTAYGSTSGTVIFDEICAGGVSGTLSNVVFEEVVGITNPTPVVGGCNMSYTTLNFSIGSCAGGPDAGVSDAGPQDASSN